MTDQLACPTCTTADSEFCSDSWHLPPDFLGGIMADQRKTWDERHEARPPALGAMRGDARKKLTDMSGPELVLATNPHHETRQQARRVLVERAERWETRCNEARTQVAELRALVTQLLEDADTTHRDPFLRGCATGTTDTARAILERLGDLA